MSAMGVVLRSQSVLEQIAENSYTEGSATVAAPLVKCVDVESCSLRGPSQSKAFAAVVRQLGA
jgi:hypothetical protein